MGLNGSGTDASNTSRRGRVRQQRRYAARLVGALELRDERVVRVLRALAVDERDLLGDILAARELRGCVGRHDIAFTKATDAL